MVDLPSMPAPNVPFINQQTGLVDSLWYAWLKQFLEALKVLGIAFDGLSGDFGDLEDTLAATKTTDVWQHFIPFVANGTIVMVQKAPYAGTILATVTDCDSGTCTVRARIDGVNVGSSNNSVSTTEQEVTHTTANTFTAGQTIDFVISSNSSCQGARIQITYEKPLL